MNVYHKYILFQNTGWADKNFSYRILSDDFIDEFLDILGDLNHEYMDRYTEDKSDLYSMTRFQHLSAVIQDVHVKENAELNMDFIDKDSLKKIAELAKKEFDKAEEPWLKMHFQRMQDMVSQKLVAGCGS